VAAAAPAATAAASSRRAAAAAAAAATEAACQLSLSGLRHIVLASGHDIPLQLLPAGHLPAGVTMYGSYDYGADDLAELQVKFEKLEVAKQLRACVQLCSTPRNAI
jgi:hypothetical protein